MQPKKDPAPNAPREAGKPLNPGTQVSRARYAPDGRTLAAACHDGKVRRWDVSGKEPAELPAVAGHNGWVTTLAFAGHTLFSADSWGRLTATDVSARDARRLWTVEEAHDGWLRALAVAPADAPLATCGKDGFVRFRARDTGEKLYEADLKADVLSVCFGADGKHLFAGDLFGVVREIEVASGKITRTLDAKELHKLDRIQDVGGVKTLMLAGDGKTLFVAGAEPKT
ncbi:MAG: WD40 repeat domain-containing protein, partial [Gemmata sp.]